MCLCACVRVCVGSSINDVMPEGVRGVRVCITNNVEGCMKKYDRGGGGGGKKCPKIA